MKTASAVFWSSYLLDFFLKKITKNIERRKNRGLKNKFTDKKSNSLQRSDSDFL